MLPWMETTTAAMIIGGPILAYFIRLERKLAEISNDLCWIKEVLNSRSGPREKEEE
ncbi:MAG: hypothetical protein L6300_06085 [Syntrophaceae bacterium]|nr:hypothetical protein [Syntrophaceae bacterium]